MKILREGICGRVFSVLVTANLLMPFRLTISPKTRRTQVAWNTSPASSVNLPAIIANFHSISSSARVSSDSGRSRPSAFAVLRLMISSIFSDCWVIGKSAGLAPLRTLLV